MPSHAKLSEPEIEALIEYVEYLSIRGQAEEYLIAATIDKSSLPAASPRDVLKECVLPAAQAWEAADRAKVMPPPAPPAATPEQFLASVAKGRDIYLAKDAQCVRCHGPQGAGDGEEKELYDDWNKRKQGTTPEETRALAGRFTLPIQRLRPRNFRDGVFHGGSAPQDLYLRIFAGIKGTPMPPAGPAPGNAAPLTPEQIWHVVDYVRSLSRSK
jgi:mono/diheme cytochrome c family protein